MELDAKAKFIERLASLKEPDRYDNESIHVKADEILLEVLDALEPDIAEAYRAAEKDCGGFWYA